MSAPGPWNNFVRVLRDTLANRPAATAVDEGAIFFATDTTELFMQNNGAWREIYLSQTEPTLALVAGAEVANVVRLSATATRVDGSAFVSTVFLVSDSPIGVTWAAVAGSGTVLYVNVGATGTLIIGRTNAAGLFEVDGTFLGASSMTFFGSLPGGEAQPSATATWA